MKTERNSYFAFGIESFWKWLCNLLQTRQCFAVLAYCFVLYSAFLKPLSIPHKTGDVIMGIFGMVVKSNARNCLCWITRLFQRRIFRVAHVCASLNLADSKPRSSIDANEP